MRAPLTFTLADAQKLEPLTDRIQRLDGILDPRGPDAAVTDALADSERDNLTAMGTVAMVVNSLRLGEVWSNVAAMAELAGLPPRAENPDGSRIRHHDMGVVRIEMDPAMREALANFAATAEGGVGVHIGDEPMAFVDIDRRTPRPPINHELKVWPEYFEALSSGHKTFELRVDDRDYRRGDTLTLREWKPVVGGAAVMTGGDYTGHQLDRRVSYVLRTDTPELGLMSGYCIMGFEPTTAWLAPAAPWKGVDPIPARDFASEADRAAGDDAAPGPASAAEKAAFDRGVGWAKEDLRGALNYSPGPAWTWNQLLDGVRELDKLAASVPDWPKIRDDLTAALGLPEATTGDTPPSYADLVERVAQARLQWGTLPDKPRGADRILNERIHQIVDHGRTPHWDDRHTTGGLAKAALCYLSVGVSLAPANPPPLAWPWDHKHWKPTTKRHNLEKAGALIAAELERMDRAGEE
jgi:hypothetical protein